MGAGNSRLASFYYGDSRRTESHESDGGSDAGAVSPSTTPTTPSGSAHWKRRSSSASFSDRAHGGAAASTSSPSSSRDWTNGPTAESSSWSSSGRTSTDLVSQSFNSIGRMLAGLGGRGGYFSSTRALRCSHESYLARPSSLHDRILAFQYEGAFPDEDDGDDANTAAGEPWANDLGYVESLKDAADFLDSAYNEVHPGSVLLVNISPRLLRRQDLYRLFGENIVEFEAQWEWPRTVGVLPMDRLLTVCASIHNWLSMSPHNVVCLHARAGVGAGAAQLLRFVSACYLCYCGEYEFVTDALDGISSPPPAYSIRIMNGSTNATGGGGSGSGTGRIGSLGYGLGLGGGGVGGGGYQPPPSGSSIATAAQRRYAQWLVTALRAFTSTGHRRAPRLHRAQHVPMVLRGLGIAGALATNGQGGCRLYALVHCRGELVGVSFRRDGTPPEWHQAPSRFLRDAEGVGGGGGYIGGFAGRYEHGDEIVLELNQLLGGAFADIKGGSGVRVAGDVAVSVYHWTGDKDRDEANPVATFAFHTGFIEPGLIRGTRRQLDAADPKALPDSFFVDLKLELDASPPPTSKSGSQLSSLDEDNDVLSFGSSFGDELLEDMRTLDKEEEDDDAFTLTTGKAADVERWRQDQLKETLDRSESGVGVEFGGSAENGDGDDNDEFADERRQLMEQGAAAAAVLQGMGATSVSSLTIAAAAAEHSGKQHLISPLVSPTKAAKESPWKRKSPSRRRTPRSSASSDRGDVTLSPPVRTPLFGSDVSSTVPASVAAVAAEAEKEKEAEGGTSPGVVKSLSPVLALAHRRPTASALPARLTLSPFSPRPSNGSESSGSQDTPSKASTPRTVLHGSASQAHSQGPAAPPPPPEFGLRAVSVLSTGSNLGCPPPPPPPPPMKVGGALNSAGFLDVPKSARNAATKFGSSLRRVFWDKVVHIGGTWWEDIAAGQSGGDAQRPLTVAHEVALRLAFTVAATKPMSRRTKLSRVNAGKPSGAPTIVSVTRANNIGIMIGRFPMTASEMARAIATGNADVSVSLEQLNILMQAAPIEDEVTALTAYHGRPEDLTPPERFLFELSRVPRLHSKLRAVEFCLQFSEACQEISDALSAIQLACDEVRNSQGLKTILTVALAAGNALNEGTARGSAAGFTLDSLHKLSDVRSTIDRGDAKGEGPSTLLDFIVAVADEHINTMRAATLKKQGKQGAGDENGGEAVVPTFSLTSELKSCAMGGRWTQADLASALARIDMGMKQVRAEAEMAAARGGEKDDERRCAEALLRFLARANARREELRRQAAATNETYRALCAYVGEGGTAAPGPERAAACPAGLNGIPMPPPPPPPPPPLPPGTRLTGLTPPPRPPPTAPAASSRGTTRDPEEVFGSLWGFARAVDAARAKRRALDETREREKRRQEKGRQDAGDPKGEGTERR